MSAITVLNTTLEWGTAEGSTTKVIKITGIPDLGGEPNTHDVSTTEDPVQVNILGRQALDSLAFEYFYDEDGANYDAVKKDEGKTLFYKLKINGGKGGVFSWSGSHSTWVTATDDDNPIKASISIVSTTQITKGPVVPGK